MAKRQITRKDDDDDDDEEDKYKDNEEEEEEEEGDNNNKEKDKANNKKQNMLSRAAPSPRRLQLSPKILMIINELFIDQFGDNLQQASSSKVNWLYLG